MKRLSMVLLAVVIHWADIAAGPGWHVTIPWLLLYVYTAAYPAYYLLRPPEGGARLHPSLSASRQEAS